MHKTNIHNKKLLVASIAIVIALALFASPIVAIDDAFATKKKKGNHVVQSISQSQASVQNSQGVYGVDSYDKTFVVLHVYPR